MSGRDSLRDIEQLRRVSYVDKERNKRLVFLTNHFDTTAKMVADVYMQRW